MSLYVLEYIIIGKKKQIKELVTAFGFNSEKFEYAQYSTGEILRHNAKDVKLISLKEVV